MFKKSNHTQAELEELLDKGFTLINRDNYTVRLEGTRQIKSNTNRLRNYRFTNPHFWSIEKKPSFFRMILNFMRG